jgi:hypothetical protein
MAQSIANNREPAGAAQQLDAYLQRQMSRASGQVRLFELFSAVLLLIGGILGALFLVALVDAWVIELRPWMRWLVLISLLGGSAAWTILVIVPLMIRRINPVYAARMVELARPEIKNGLINYLLLRSVERSGQPVSRRVIELVGSRAAHDISGVEISETIDKSRSVRAAMFLVLVLGAFATYLFLSPKSPFQTIARVLAPSADLARPARVRIFEVQPGDAVAFFGQPVKISARVSGRFAEEPVSVVYSTTDGQVINATLGMQPSESADESWSVVLRTDERGVGQSLTYHVEAGDGKSSTYSLIVKSTPMLTVDRIEYRFPEYTRLPELRETGNPEIHGLEGTTVTVHAVANTELKQARLELLNRIREGNYEVVGTVPLQVADKKNASGSFQLQLDTRRQAQLWSHYRLELTTTDGTRGDPGTPFPIKVIPDLAPEIQILEPEQPEVTLPLNSRLRFFVRAQDQDFELRRIVAYGTSLGVPAFEKEVPIPPDADQAGQINVAFDLVPKELLLRAGETVVVNFEAVDNRTALTSNAADPNRTRSNNVIVTITPPVENPEESTPPPDGNEQNDKGDSKTGENNPPPRENDKGEKKKDERGPEGDDPGSDEKEQGNKDEKNPDDPGEGDDSGDKQNDKDKNDPSSGENDSGDSKGNKNQGRNKDDKNSSENKGDEGEGAGSDSEPAAGAGRDKSDSAKGQKSDGKQTGAGEKSDKKGDKSGSQDSQTEQSAESGSSGESDPQNQQGNSDGSPANPDDTGSQGNRPGENGNSQDQMSEDAHPGEIFEEINRFREQKQNNDRGQGQEQKGSEESGDNKGDKASPDEKSSGNPGDKSDGGDKSQGNPQASDKQGGKNQGADKQGGDKQNDQKQGDGEKENSSNASQQQDGDKTNQGNPSQGEDEGNSGQNEKSSSAGSQGEEKSGDKKDGDKSSGGGEESEKGEQKDESTTKEPRQGGPPEETSGGESPGSSGDQKGDSAGGQGGEKSGDPSAGKQGNKSAGDPSGKGNGDEKTGGDPSSQKGDGKASGDTKAPANKPGNEQGSSQAERAPGEGNQGTGDDAGKQAGGGEGDGKGQKGDGQGDSGQGSKGGGGSENPDGSGSETGGGGSPSSGSGSGAAQNKKNPTGQDVGADEANLEFTKKATDLALEYLEGQQEDPDPELLERLNWTEQELREFVQRWKDLKARAESGNEADKRQLEQELRSLGLTQPETAVGEKDIDRDQQSGYREEGRVSNAPPGFKAFQRRRNRTDENKK